MASASSNRALCLASVPVTAPVSDQFAVKYREWRKKATWLARLGEGKWRFIFDAGRDAAAAVSGPKTLPESDSDVITL